MPDWFWIFMLYMGIFMAGMLTGMIYILEAKMWKENEDELKEIEGS